MATYIDKVENDSIIIQIKELIEDHPEVLHYRMDKTDYPMHKLGKNGPYECTGCWKSNIEISQSGHSKNCKWKRVGANFKILQSQLNRWESNNLELIIKELSA